MSTNADLVANKVELTDGSIWELTDWNVSAWLRHSGPAHQLLDYSFMRRAVCPFLMHETGSYYPMTSIDHERIARLLKLNGK